mmetsp:Transcript_16283/g.33701  ORF Transcript_16283/g.33701 Transcript_16283/m.33701 type:complete len:371 (-) Transcript_16283:555-1667(-)
MVARGLLCLCRCLTPTPKREVGAGVDKQVPESRQSAKTASQEHPRGLLCICQCLTGAGVDEVHQSAITASQGHPSGVDEAQKRQDSRHGAALQSSGAFPQAVQGVQNTAHMAPTHSGGDQGMSQEQEQNPSQSECGLECVGQQKQKSPRAASKQSSRPSSRDTVRNTSRLLTPEDDPSVRPKDLERRFSVKVQQGHRTDTIQLHPKETLRDVKHSIQSSVKDTSGPFHLYRRFNQEEQTVSQCGITEGTTLIVEDMKPARRAWFEIGTVSPERLQHIQRNVEGHELRSSDIITTRIESMPAATCQQLLDAVDGIKQEDCEDLLWVERFCKEVFPSFLLEEEHDSTAVFNRFLLGFVEKYNFGNGPLRAIM